MQEPITQKDVKNQVLESMIEIPKPGEYVLCVNNMEDYGNNCNLVTKNKIYKVETVNKGDYYSLGWITITGKPGLKMDFSNFIRIHLQVIK